MALSQELYSSCRETLLKCNEFNNNDSLRAIFVTTELKPYQDGLPQPSDKGERVSQTINYLLPLRLSGNQSVFPLFLMELKNRRYSSDALFDELDELYVQMVQELSDKIIIPFVIAAMTDIEANDLVNENVFADPTISKQDSILFQKFKKALEDHGFNNLTTYYKENRESWHPPIYPSGPIDQIIYGTLQYINDNHREPYHLPILLPQFLSEEFFSQDQEIRRQVLKQLGRVGGVLIVDAISMFHPLLYRRIRRSEVGSNKQVALFILSPLDTTTLVINQLIEDVLGSQMETAFTRLASDWELSCEIGTGGLRTINRWLAAVLPSMASNLQKLEPSLCMRQKWHKKRGETVRGIHQAFPGGLGSI